MNRPQLVCRPLVVSLSVFLFACGLGLGLAWQPVSSAFGQEAKPSDAPTTLKLIQANAVEPTMTLATFEKAHRLIKPQSGECKFADIPWEPTIWEGRKKAAKEGKPLFIWYMVGEPLGQC